MKLRGRWRRLWRRVELPLVVGVVLVSMPVMIPVAMVQHVFIERRKKRRAEVAPCVRCGVVLGARALARSDAEWAAYVNKLHRDHPGKIFRLVRGVDAVCVECEQPHRYDEAANAFVVADAPRTGERQKADG